MTTTKALTVIAATCLAVAAIAGSYVAGMVWLAPVVLMAHGAFLRQVR